MPPALPDSLRAHWEGEGAALSGTVSVSDGADPRRIDCDQLRAISGLGCP